MSINRCVRLRILQLSVNAVKLKKKSFGTTRETTEKLPVVEYLVVLASFD